MKNHISTEELSKHISELSYNYPTNSIHGPFKDITIHSPDSSIASISKARIIDAIETAIVLDSETLILHTGINTKIRNKQYLANAIRIQVDFYKEVLEQNKNLKINIENMWESDPEPFMKMYELVENERFGICIDTGHANIFGNISVDNWIKQLGDRIKYFHLNDNFGEYDSESALGDGNINWDLVFREINSLPEQAIVAVMEVGSIDNILKSLAVAEKFRDAI